MKKVLSLFILMAAFCVVGFAQSAPKVAKKAMLMPANVEIKNLKTDKVIRVTKGTVQKPTSNEKKIVKIKMTREGANTPTNSKQSPNNLPVKQLPNSTKLLKRLNK